jgi:hypothetical protein
LFEIFSNILLNLLKKRTEGIAATRPRAVAKRASAIPGATTAKLVFCDIPIAVKLFIIPHTVPKSPIKGAVDPTEARKFSPFSKVLNSLLITISISFLTFSQKAFLKSKFLFENPDFTFSKYTIAEKKTDSIG